MNTCGSLVPLKTLSRLSVKVFEQMTVSSEHIIERSMNENIKNASEYQIIKNSTIQNIIHICQELNFL